MAERDYKKEMEDAIKVARWQGEVNGKIDGAMNVLFLLDLDKEKRIELLGKAVGLSGITAAEFIEPRQIQENIYKNTKLSVVEQNQLSDLMENEAMNDERIMDHPVEVINLIVTMKSDFMLEKCIPQVKKWVKAGEDVSMRRIKDWYIEKYKLF